MGQPPENTTNETAAFSLGEASAAAHIAALPNIYERAYGVDNDRTAALDAVSEAAPGNISQVNFISIDSTTVIMAFDASQSKAYIAFDPTHTFGDKWDNFRRGHEDHALGGEVHGGLYGDIAADQTPNENFPGDSMTDVMGMVLHDYASKSPGQSLSVDFVGFSSGGVQTALAAGQMISEDFFADNPNIKLDNVYTLGSPAYADEEFTAALEGAASNLGAGVWHVQIHGDEMPAVLSTAEGGNRFTRYDYSHAGEHVYLVPDAEAGKLQILLNPSDETIATLPEPARTSKETHTMDSYINTLENRAVEPIETVTPEQVPTDVSFGNNR